MYLRIRDQQLLNVCCLREKEKQRCRGIAGASITKAKNKTLLQLKPPPGPLTRFWPKAGDSPKRNNPPRVR